MQTLPGDGIQKLPTIHNGERVDTSDWGTMRARLNEQPGTKTFGRHNFYIHNSNKGFSSGCIEIGKGFFPKLLTYAKYYGSIDLSVKYPTSNSPTLGKTWKH